MAARLTTNTWTRAEWDAAQRGGTEGGFNPDAIQRTSYEEYLKNAGFKSEAEAMAQRAKEDEEGVKFGEVKSADEIKQLSERKGTPEYLAELDAAGAKTREEEARRIALLSKGYITGKEPVYIWGTPENIAWQKAANAYAMQTNTQPEVPNAYLDAQAFAARYAEYNRYGATTPTVTLWDDAKKQYVTQPNPFFNPKVLEVTPGMGNQWDKLERAKWATVVPGVGSTKATEQAEYDLLNFFSRTVAINGDPMPAGYRFFMRTPGDIVAGTSTPAGTTTTTKPKTVVSTTKDANGNTITKYSNGSVTTTDASGIVTTTDSGTPENIYDYGTKEYADFEKRVSAYDLLYKEFDSYGLGSLVAPLKDLITSGVSDSEFTIKLRETPAYQKRFAANKKRIANGFKAIDEATYLGLEDTFQSLAQNYGMPASYYAKGELGVQPYFEEAIANNVDPVTFEDRIMEGKKVLDANKNTLTAIKEFFPTLNDGDFLAYVLDTKNGLSDIQRKVTSAQIGGAQLGAGLAATAAGADELAKAGITGQKYQQEATAIAEDTMRGGQLAEMYKQTPYTQQTAEADILNLAGATEAKRQTKKLTQLETAAFSGRAGTGAIARDRAGIL